MTENQAKRIKKHLIEQLHEYGFGFIVTEIESSLENIYYEPTISKTEKNILQFYLIETKSVFESISNNNYENLLSRFNNVLSESPILKISVKLENSEEQFDLKDLPNFEEVIDLLNTILSKISINE